MPALSKVYESDYDYKLDPKYRVSVPVGFRPDEGDSVRLQISKEHDEKVIKVFTLEAFEDKFRQIEAAEISQGQKNTLAGALRMKSKQVAISNQGKLTIPKDWADKIGLKADGSVKLAGRDGYWLVCTEDGFNRIGNADLEMDDGGLGVL